MVICQEDLDKFVEADVAYEQSRSETEERQRSRDAAVLQLTRNATVRQVAQATGLSPGRVQQIVARARAASS